ncbi:hypothetical protein FQN57_007056 [Myotisia sp. PD_48]|nr:hypothetical protein FQN57_007056 [Myotisia sp. PD_48]
MFVQQGDDGEDPVRPAAHTRSIVPLASSPTPISYPPRGSSFQRHLTPPSPSAPAFPPPHSASSPSFLPRGSSRDHFLPKHLNTSHALTPPRSPISPDGLDHGPSRQLESGAPGFPKILKPSTSMPNVRAKKYFAFQPDHSPRSQRSSPLGQGTAQGKHQYYSPELHFDVPSRSSLQSAMTVSTSVGPASATERSSVATKTSSATELSPGIEEEEDEKDESDEKENEKDLEMSVDDAIDMYLEGFSDDPPQALEKELQIQATRESLASTKSSLSTIADLPDSDKAPIPIHGLPSKPPIRRTPSPTIPIDIQCNGEPPPLSTPNKLRDQYGFRKATTHVTTEQYDSWYESYSGYIETRRAKWFALLRSSGIEEPNPVTFPIRSNKVKRYIRKGLPPECRGAAWFWYAGGYDHIRRNPGHYKRLVETAFRSPMNDDKEHIERDLHRTFPDNIHFKPDPPSETVSHSESRNTKHNNGNTETPIIQSLRRVLYAFSLHNSKIGYTQSLNFIAGFLVLFLAEEKAFWMLHIITASYFPGTHEISLEGANADLWILMVALKESLTGVYTKVASTTPTTPKSKPPSITTATRLPDITLGLTNWLMSIFISSLPIESTLRVWDILFYEGSRTFFRVALAIFRLCQKQIASLSDPMEIFQIVQTAPKKMVDPNVLMNECFSRRFKFSQLRVDSLRDARRQAIREDKDRASFLPGPRKVGADLDGRPSTSATSPLPGAWRTLKNHIK